jgi:6-phosphofructokinase 2
MTPRFLTLTPNPALDLSTAVERIEPSHKMRCEAPQVHAGGGGINVARVLHRLGATVRAVFPMGGPTGERLCRSLAGEGVATDCLPIAGETRESFTVRESSTGRELRFVLPGPTWSEDEWQACLERLRQEPAPAWLVASGSLPPGAPADFYARAARIAQERGSRFVLDSSGPALQKALEAGVFLVKPSLRELRELTGAALTSQGEQREAAATLVAGGRAQVVALSLGSEGAMLVTPQGSWRASALAVPVVSTVGAGDSFLAGLVWALDSQPDPAQAFRTAMAAGAAALLAPGTALCTPEDLHRLRAQVQVTPLG